MRLQEAHEIIQDYFLDHANQMTRKQTTAFMLTLLALPLIPQCYRITLDNALESITHTS